MQIVATGAKIFHKTKRMPFKAHQHEPFRGIFQEYAVTVQEPQGSLTIQIGHRISPIRKSET